MKFRMFTDAKRVRKIAVHVDSVISIYENHEKKTTEICMVDRDFEVSEDFDTVFSRLNTIAE